MARDSASRANNPSPESASTDTSESRIPATENRSGQDERRRGWFWHWNGVVTQYTPLIGLKGIGLLNSYTVWTDRREDSPHRGYAFPSQQSEANFYGEDRAELITINKILVALDLIEIRKEMVRKTDEKGRRWKVPQNLYRVKDRQEGLDLTTADVIRVIELADRDKAVYRYIRKLFSSRFEPIDRNSIWHTILTEIDAHPTWQKLAARAAKQEARASARTKAGHRSRARQKSQDTGSDADDREVAERDQRQAQASRGMKDSAALLTTGHVIDIPLPGDEQSSSEQSLIETSDESTNSGSRVAADKSNNGPEVPDELGNSGLSNPEGGSVASSNNGCESSVEPGNTMYYQSPSTTTTTTTSVRGCAGRSTSAADAPLNQADNGSIEGEVAVGDQDATKPGDEAPPATTSRTVVTGDASPGGSATKSGLAGTAGGGPLGDPSPLVLSLYEAANDRAATRLERILLSELEADAGAPATAAGSTGPEWVAEALREAVGSGSSFVAPKRIREIIKRWAVAGAGPTGAVTTTNGQSKHADKPRDRVGIKPSLEKSIENYGAVEVLHVSREDAAQGDRLWGVVLDILAADDACDDLFRLRGVVPLGERDDGAFVLGAPTRTSARLLSGRHRHSIEQALSSLLPSPASIAVLDPDQWQISS